MDLLGSLGTLATNVKNITLPGVFAALAFALLIWPPRTYDRVPTVVENHPDIVKLRLSAGQLTDDSEASLGEYLKQSAPACTVKEGADSYKFLIIPSSLRDRSSVAVRNQLLLDDIDRSLLKCVEEEQALQGIEDQATTYVNALIVTRTSERDGINSLYQKYILSLSPMQGEFKEKLERKEGEIATLQAHVLNLQRVQKELIGPSSVSSMTLGSMTCGTTCARRGSRPAMPHLQNGSQSGNRQRAQLFRQTGEELTRFSQRSLDSVPTPH